MKTHSPFPPILPFLFIGCLLFTASAQDAETVTIPGVPHLSEPPSKPGSISKSKSKSAPLIPEPVTLPELRHQIGDTYKLRMTAGQYNINVESIPKCDLRAEGEFLVTILKTNANGHATTCRLECIELLELNRLHGPNGARAQWGDQGDEPAGAVFEASASKEGWTLRQVKGAPKTSTLEILTTELPLRAIHPSPFPTSPLQPGDSFPMPKAAVDARYPGTLEDGEVTLTYKGIIERDGHRLAHFTCEADIQMLIIETDGEEAFQSQLSVNTKGSILADPATGLVVHDQVGGESSAVQVLEDGTTSKIHLQPARYFASHVLRKEPARTTNAGAIKADKTAKATTDAEPQPRQPRQPRHKEGDVYDVTIGQTLSDVFFLNDYSKVVSQLRTRITVLGVDDDGKATKLKLKLLETIDHRLVNYQGRKIKYPFSKADGLGEGFVYMAEFKEREEGQEGGWLYTMKEGDKEREVHILFSLHPARELNRSVLPEEAITPGDSWSLSKEELMALHPTLKEGTDKRTFVQEGLRDGKHVMKIQQEADHQIGWTQGVKKGDKHHTESATYLIDSSTGLIRVAVSTVKIETSEINAEGVSNPISEKPVIMDYSYSLQSVESADPTDTP